MKEPPSYAYDEEEGDDCWNCGGEGFVCDCYEPWACCDPESGCDDCTKPCDVCKPRKVPG